MTRVAAVDCGTNTIRLLVADLDPAAGEARELAREVRIVRLGQDVDRTGRFAEEALVRVFAAAEEYAALVREHAAEAVRVCATSAARDVDNAEALLDGMRERLGVPAEVITGAQEAALTFAGATRGLAGVEEPVLVVDIGGGSTEFVIGGPGGRARAAHSLDIGSVRITERLLPSDPPTAEEVGAATRLIDGALDELPGYGVRLADARTVVGVAGTVTNLAFVHRGLPEYDRAVIHHSRLAAADVSALTQRLLGISTEQRTALGIQPGRADVIAAGALILDRALQRSGVADVLVSESDILDGIAWSVA